MPESAFPSTGTRRYELPCGYWIDLKEELSAGERRYSQGAALRSMRFQAPREGHVRPTETELMFDSVAAMTARAFVFLSNWSIVDASGRIAKLSAENIGNLKENVFEEIDKKIDEHEDIMKAEQSEKNVALLVEPAKTPTSH